MNDQTLGQRIGKAERRAMNDAVIESNYKGGQLFAPLQFKADDDDGSFMKPVRFKGFANTGMPDLGGDIVDRPTLNPHREDLPLAISD